MPLSFWGFLALFLMNFQVVLGLADKLKGIRPIAYWIIVLATGLCYFLAGGLYLADRLVGEQHPQKIYILFGYVFLVIVSNYIVICLQELREGGENDE